jgi:hypothetical protein
MNREYYRISMRIATGLEECPFAMRNGDRPNDYCVSHAANAAQHLERLTRPPGAIGGGQQSQHVCHWPCLSSASSCDMPQCPRATGHSVGAGIGERTGEGAGSGAVIRFLIYRRVTFATSEGSVTSILPVIFLVCQTGFLLRLWSLSTARRRRNRAHFRWRTRSTIRGREG